jgi:hypothetical protein
MAVTGDSFTSMRKVGLTWAGKPPQVLAATAKYCSIAAADLLIGGLAVIIHECMKLD